MKNFSNKIEMGLIGIKNRVGMQLRALSEQVVNDEEGADTVEIVLGIAIFAAIAIITAKLLGGAIEAKGTEAAAVIESASFK